MVFKNQRRIAARGISKEVWFMVTRRGGKRLAVSTVFFTFFFAAFISIFSQGCALAWTCAGSTSQCADYLAAINDAKDNFDASRIWNQLTPITTENPDLIWKDGVPGSKVLVAAYKSAASGGNAPFYDCQPGVAFPKDCPVYGSPWVTAVPELYDFFRNRAFTPLRIEQLLGLPPNYGNTYIVEYWADPKDLFRPAPDPQITYSQGNINFPWQTSNLLLLNTTNDYLVYDDYCYRNATTDPCYAAQGTATQWTTYQCWFTNRRAYVYSYDYSSAPYPWTGLGYTYDWGNPKTPVGLSEFVLNKAHKYGDYMTVTIQSVTLATQYFGKGTYTKYALTLEKSGLGKGQVYTRPGGINCTANCSAQTRNFNRYSQVTLTAKPARGSTFTGWGGACASASGTSCTITLPGPTTVTASFALN